MAIQFTLLKEKTLSQRLDVLPFLLGYLVMLYYYLFISTDDQEVYYKIGLIVLVFLNCLTYLLGFWSKKLNSFIQYSRISGKKTVQKLSKATHILVCYKPKQRSTIFDIVPLLGTMSATTPILKDNLIKKEEIQQQEQQIQQGIFYFKFMEKKYIFDDKEKFEFYRLKPELSEKTVQFFTESISAPSPQPQLFDQNDLIIPIKKFKDLLRDQLMEPFSFFQMFSVSLWLMDENRFYAILTLSLLFMTSCTVVIQRLRTHIMLRQMRLNPQYIQTYRDNNWVRISSEELRPGDLCIIQPSHQIKANENFVRETDEEFLKREIPFSKHLPMKFFKTENMKIDSYKVLPCDFLLLTGNCVVNEAVLTGESVPQIKDSIEKLSKNDVIDYKKGNKNSVLFCGTEVLQTFPNEKIPECIKKRPSGNACIAYVLRTAYDTSKGKLIRTVLFNNENLNIKQKDAFILIVILLIFSIISSAYVLIHGLEDQSRDRNKLFLRCILIITTVVPPELPMILTIAVNSSLLYLQRKKIFCTEPFRIPYGGMIKTLAFDKTGTLTSDTLLFRGIIDKIENQQYKQPKLQINQSSDEIQSVLSGCHSLLYMDKKLTGDPIELLFFDNSDWEYSSLDKTAACKRNKMSGRIVNLFPFKSDLKRMSTVVYWNQFDKDIKEYRALCKGAPEVIQTLLTNVPQDYSEAYKYYTKQGYRVLSLAYKKLASGCDLQSLERSDVECDLIFAGFFICESPLKRDTFNQIKYLHQAEYSIIMITGDNSLTAISVGQQLCLGPKIYRQQQIKQNQQKFLSLEEHQGKFYWVDESEKEITFEVDVDKDQNYFKYLSENAMLCISGPAIEIMSQQKQGLSVLKIGLKYFSIFARTSPYTKEFVISMLKDQGIHTLMCGDGTNDVGALKKADVGIALVGLKEQTEEEYQLEKQKKRKQKEEILRDPRKAMQQMGGLFEEVNYKFGDACIAAPFTSKHSSSIRCVQILLRRGICTLVTTIQTYKILSLSSLIQAYMLSSLNMQALKFSEFQYTILGITAAINYYYFSNTKPLKKISTIKPSPTIFEPYFILSVLGQVGIHLYGTLKSVEIGILYSSPEDLKITHDQEFKPTFLNTALFLYSLLSQTCIFLFNNGGEPHMEGFSTNKRFLKILGLTLIFTYIFALDLPSDMAESFDLTFVGVNQEANISLFLLFILITIANYIVEIGLRFLKYRKLFYWI